MLTVAAGVNLAEINTSQIDVVGSEVQGSEFSPAAGQIEKETSLEPNKFNNGNL
jgi:hypothetical protein